MVKMGIEPKGAGKCQKATRRIYRIDSQVSVLKGTRKKKSMMATVFKVPEP